MWKSYVMKTRTLSPSKYPAVFRCFPNVYCLSRQSLSPASWFSQYFYSLSVQRIHSAYKNFTCLSTLLCHLWALARHIPVNSLSITYVLLFIHPVNRSQLCLFGAALDVYPTSLLRECLSAVCVHVTCLVFTASVWSDEHRQTVEAVPALCLSYVVFCPVNEPAWHNDQYLWPLISQ